MCLSVCLSCPIGHSHSYVIAMVTVNCTLPLKLNNIRLSLKCQVVVLHSAGSESVLKEGLPEECQSACVCALTKLQEVSDSILSGDITMRDLSTITQQSQKFQALCDAVQGRHTICTFEYSSVEKNLSLRTEEFEEFSRYKSYLLNLLSHLNMPEISHTFPGLFTAMALHSSLSS